MEQLRRNLTAAEGHEWTADGVVERLRECGVRYEGRAWQCEALSLRAMARGEYRIAGEREPAGPGCYSAFTDYEYAMVRSISMTTHLGLDVAGGLLLAVSPWLFQFSEHVWIPHVVVGVIEIGTAPMTQTRPSPAGHTSRGMHTHAR